MTGPQMKALRESLGMNDIQFGIALGYNGTSNTIYQTIRRFESGQKPIPHWIAVTARALDTKGMWDAIHKTDYPASLGAVSTIQSFLQGKAR